MSSLLITLGSLSLLGGTIILIGLYNEIVPVVLGFTLITLGSTFFFITTQDYLIDHLKEALIYTKGAHYDATGRFVFDISTGRTK